MGVKKNSLSPIKPNVSIITTAKHSSKKKSLGGATSAAEESFSTPSKSKKTPKKAKHLESEKKPDLKETAAVTPNKKSSKKSLNTTEIHLSDDEDFQQKPKSKKASKKDKGNITTEILEGEAEAVEDLWPTEDLNELFSQIENNLPKNDTVNYKSRTELLDWEKVAFKMYSAQDCHTMWDTVSKKLRTFRLLRELLEDARQWSKTPWQDFHKKNKEHPEMPRKPLGTYMIYFKQAYEKAKKKYPNENLTELTKKISAKYRSLSEEKKQKYAAIAAEQRAEYEVGLEKFYEKHPHLRPAATSSKSKKKGKTVSSAAEDEEEPDTIKLPSKPVGPFRLFYEDKLKNEKNSHVDKIALQAKCRELWNKMSDAKKGVWINLSVEREEKYKEELEAYKSQNPDYEPSATPFKSCLTKDDIVIRDRLLGKPDKPPNSAYSLFSTLLLGSDELKTAPSKDRMLLISQQWRNLDPTEKKTYEDRVANLKEAYKADYAAYLKTLSPEQRELQIQPEPRKAKKQKHVEDEEEQVNNANEKKIKLGKKVEGMKTLFEGEPEAPPIHPSLLFAKSYRGNPSTVQAAWKSLSAKTQTKYKRKLEEMKQKYMIDYEIFLKNLNEEQLQDYSNVMKLRNGGKDLGIDSSSSENESGSSSEDEEEEEVKQQVVNKMQDSEDSDSDSSDDE